MKKLFPFSLLHSWKILKKDTAAVEAAKKDVDPEAVAAELAAAKQRLAEKFRRVNSVVRHGALSDPAAVAASNAAVAAATEAVRERERAIGELALAEFGDDDAGLDGADVFLNAFGYCLPAAARFSQLSSAMPAPLFDPVEARRRLACRGGRGAVEGAFCAIVDAAERCKEVSGGSRGGSGNAGAAAAFDRGEFLMHVLAEGTLRARNGPPKVKTAQGQPPAPGPAASGTFTAPAAAARRASSPLPSPPPPPAATSAAAATSIGAAGTAACQQAKARGLSDPEADASMARAMTAANDAIPPLPFETARDHVFALQLATLTAARAAGADADEAREAGMAALHREVLASTWVQLSVAANVRREELAKVAAAEQAPAAKAAKVEVVPPLAHFVAVVVSRSVEELAKWESAAKGKPWGPDAAAVSSRQQQKGGNGGGGNGGGGGKNKGRVTNQGAGPSAA